METIVVTGGCGYIGSHVVRQLSEAGYTVIVYDNLSTGYRDALLYGEELVVGDMSDTDLLNSVISTSRCTTVIHFAASIVVPESVVNPLKYYENNTRNTLNLLRILVDNKIANIVFSSTAAVYGVPTVGVVTEQSSTIPISPYGASKLMSEWMLRDIAAAHGMRYVALRYFNVAGADPDARIGQRFADATHLIKVCCQAALGIRDSVSVFGSDYSTPDGTCVRDFIHIEDLASAHLAALNFLNRGGTSSTFNIGYGHGNSVREVVDVVRRVSGIDFDVIEDSRRLGDPPILIANVDKAHEILQWKPQYDNLEQIVADAWRWECKMAGNKMVSP